VIYFPKNQRKLQCYFYTNDIDRFEVDFKQQILDSNVDESHLQVMR